MKKTKRFSWKVLVLSGAVVGFSACTHRSQTPGLFGDDDFKGSDTSWESLADAAPMATNPKVEDALLAAKAKEAPKDPEALAPMEIAPKAEPTKEKELNRDPFALPEGKSKEKLASAPIANNDIDIAVDPVAASFNDAPKPVTDAPKEQTVFNNDLPSATLFGEEPAVKKVKKTKARKVAKAAPKFEPVAEPTVQRSSKKLAKVKIPKAPIARKGEKLNRYYFVRQGDTAESLARLFYGDEKQAAELEKWNGKSVDWKVGSLVFYVSADQPDDKTMQSFYREQGVEAETVELRPGEDVAMLAHERFGDEKSWREIAALNKINPNKLKAGQSLQVYPVTLTGVQLAKGEMAKTTAELAQNSGAQAAAAQPAKPTVDQILAETAVGDGKMAKALPPPANEEPLFAKKDKEKSKEKLASFEVAQPMQRHFASLMIIVGFALAALLIVFVIRARRRANEFEFFD